MALRREFLKALGIEDEKADEIIKAHTETVEALKAQRDEYKTTAEQYKADAGKLSGVQSELDSLKKLAAENDGKNPFELKYNAVKEEFEAFKAEITAKETKTAKEKAYGELLKAAGVPEKRLASIIKVTNLDEIELERDGKIKNADKHAESVKSEWADFISTNSQQGAEPATPPVGDSGSPTSDIEMLAASLQKNFQESTYGALPVNNQNQT